MDETEQQDRTEDPTERRLSEARDRGEVARSRDLAGAVVTIGVLLSLVMVSAPLAYGAKALLQVGLVYRPEQLVSDAVMTRSEEHTSELQSLMRISYSVFCLKNKK